jgi:hypothetical protein
MRDAEKIPAAYWKFWRVAGRNGAGGPKDSFFVMDNQESGVATMSLGKMSSTFAASSQQS